MIPAGKTPVIAIVDDEEMVLTSLRSFLTLETDFGPIRVKIGRQGAAITRFAPEYDDVAAAAAKHGVSFQTVFDAARKLPRSECSRAH